MIPTLLSLSVQNILRLLRVLNILDFKLQNIATENQRKRVINTNTVRAGCLLHIHKWW